MLTRSATITSSPGSSNSAIIIGDEGGGTEQRKGQWCILMKPGAMNITGRNWLGWRKMQ